MDLPLYCDLLELLMTTADESVMSAARADYTNDTAKINTRMSAENFRIMKTPPLVFRRYISCRYPEGAFLVFTVRAGINLIPQFTAYFALSNNLDFIALVDTLNYL